MSQLFGPLQDAITAHIETLADFSNTPVIAFKAGDLNSAIDQQLNRTSGQCALVMPPTPTRVADCPKMVFENVSITIRLISYLHHDNSLPAILTLAESLSYGLHQWSPALQNWHGKLRLNETNPWETHFSERATEPNRIDVNFGISGKLNIA